MQTICHQFRMQIAAIIVDSIDNNYTYHINRHVHELHYTNLHNIIEIDKLV